MHIWRHALMFKLTPISRLLCSCNNRRNRSDVHAFSQVHCFGISSIGSGGSVSLWLWGDWDSESLGLWGLWGSGDSVGSISFISIQFGDFGKLGVIDLVDSGKLGA
jgi:hypothetical protein